jgi:rSAM/selenodomain-associated transferase 2
MLSAIVSALNAAAHIGACLDALGGADEIVVVDGGSSDGTAEIAKGARVISSPCGRGVQLAAGAAEARGAWLLFVHADTVLSRGWRAAAERHMASEPAGAACFRFALDAAEWQARAVEAGVAARVRLLGLPYGDQGLLVSRAHYEAVGGYQPLPLMEDVDLVRRLGRVRVLEADALTSAERWRRDGWVRRSARNLSILTLYRLGVPAERLARLYG